MYKAIVTKLSNVRAHSNADRIRLATVCGNQVVVDITASNGDWGVFFDVDGQLSDTFTAAAQLFNKASLNKDPEGKTGFFDSNARVKAKSFRGERSEGFFMPWVDFQNTLSKLDIKVALDLGDGDSVILRNKIVFKPGTEFDSIRADIESIEICRKYVNPKTLLVRTVRKESGQIKDKPKAPMFHEHFSTPQLGRNVELINNKFDGYPYVLTLKTHGTSGRTTHTLVKRPVKLNWLQNQINKMRPGTFKTHTTEWEYMNGSRRVNIFNKGQGGYHTESTRDVAAKPFIGNLKKGETVYYEILGYEQGTEEPKTIMPSCDIAKLKGHLSSKEIKKVKSCNRDKDDVIWDYGCAEGSLRIEVYRITLTNEDGYEVDYSWDAMVQRCSELGVKPVTLIASHQWDPETSYDNIKSIANKHYDGIREGVVVRFEGITPTFYKEKSFVFKVLEGIISDSGAVDPEEAEKIDGE